PEAEHRHVVLELGPASAALDVDESLIGDEAEPAGDRARPFDFVLADEEADDARVGALDAARTRIGFDADHNRTGLPIEAALPSADEPVHGPLSEDGWRAASIAAPMPMAISSRSTSPRRCGCPASWPSSPAPTATRPSACCRSRAASIPWRATRCATAASRSPPSPPSTTPPPRRRSA